MINADTHKHIEELWDMVAERLRAWAEHEDHQVEKQPTLPQHILMYRDGVSESQYKEIFDFELSQFRKAYKRARHELFAEDFDPLQDYKDDASIHYPSVTFIITGKRHHVRFYPMNESDTYGRNKGVRALNSQVEEEKKWDSATQKYVPTGNFFWTDAKNGNLKPGLVVDQVVTHSRNYDFYLQSHDAIVGTARSAHYYVLANDMNLSPNALQDIVCILIALPKPSH